MATTIIAMKSQLMIRGVKYLMTSEIVMEIDSHVEINFSSNSYFMWLYIK